MTDTKAQNGIKTLIDLAELIAEKETEFAPGSETAILGAFVGEYDHVSSILYDDSKLDGDRDETAAYERYETAYKKMAGYEAAGIDYEFDNLW